MGRSFLSDPMMKSNYKITITGNGRSITIGASKVSGLSSKVNVIKYQEGGESTDRQLPGRLENAPVTIERGIYNKGYSDSAGALYDELAKRHYEMIEVLKTGSGASTSERFTVIIKLKDMQKKTAHKWTLSECWFSEWNMDDLEAKSDDIAIEKVVLVYEDCLHETS